MTPALKKILFEINSCTGYHEDFSPNELLTKNHSPLAKGWQSERFCVFPQIIKINLTPGNCLIRKVQILSHHFKISTKIDLYCGRRTKRIQNKYCENDEDIEDVEYEKLGHVNFCHNTQSGFQARELKSIHLEAEGDSIKFVIHKCHINSLNLYNQVGIVAINILGEINDSDYFVKTLSDPCRTLIGLDPLVPDPSWNVEHDNHNAAFWGLVQKDEHNEFSIDDLAFDIYQDRQIAKMIAAVMRSKEVAAGEEVARLEVTKQRAIEVEEYDIAETLKSDVQKIKHALMVKMKSLGLKLNEHGLIVMLSENDEADISKQVESDPDLTVDRPRSEPFDTDVQPISIFPPKTPTEGSKPTEPLKPYQRSGLDDPEQLTDEEKIEFEIAILVFGEFLIQCLLSKQFKLREWALTQISARIDGWDQKLKKEELKKKKIQLHPRHKDFESEENQRCLNTPKDKGNTKNTHQSVGKVSSQKELPEAGLWDENDLLNQEKIRTGWFGEAEAKFVDRQTFSDAVFKIILKGLDDNREKAIQLVISLWDQWTNLTIAIGNAYHKLPYSIFPFLLAEFSPPCGKENKKIKKNHENNISTIHWRLIKGRLEMINFILKIFNIDDFGLRKNLKREKIGLNFDNVLEFIVPYLNNGNLEVREEAIKVIIILAEIVGLDEIEKFLNNLNLNVQILKLIKDKLSALNKNSVRVVVEKMYVNIKYQDYLIIKLDKKVTAVVKEDGDGKKYIEVRDNPEKAKACIFCDYRSTSVNFQESKDLENHYWYQCPMLCCCPLCQSVVEIQFLTSHMTSECTGKNLIKQCPRCSEAIMREEFSNHINRQGCTGNKAPLFLQTYFIVIVCHNPSLRCPFCHFDVSDGENGWKNHLVNGYGCFGNPRTKKEHSNNSASKRKFLVKKADSSSPNNDHAENFLKKNNNANAIIIKMQKNDAKKRENNAREHKIEKLPIITVKRRN
ncbi:hypothetical protein HK099_005677 [Clydaea vesicula]|uniref:TOG domain-containing protein n=1 Tax=Clydaea vesicula TaxID=447962 RepID=A0AAD5XXF7_9FUNG|nr:hypothetical protein HK099_005677 [Clydaea vesicula]